MICGTLFSGSFFAGEDVWNDASGCGKNGSFRVYYV